MLVRTLPNRAWPAPGGPPAVVVARLQGARVFVAETGTGERARPRSPPRFVEARQRCPSRREVCGSRRCSWVGHHTRGPTRCRSCDLRTVRHSCSWSDSADSSRDAEVELVRRGTAVGIGISVCVDYEPGLGSYTIDVRGTSISRNKRLATIATAVRNPCGGVRASRRRSKPACPVKGIRAHIDEARQRTRSPYLYDDDADDRLFQSR